MVFGLTSGSLFECIITQDGLIVHFNEDLITKEAMASSLINSQGSKTSGEILGVIAFFRSFSMLA